MNREDFEKLVRPYLKYIMNEDSQSLIPSMVNHSLIIKKFQKRQQDSDGYGDNHILEENILIYIPIDSTLINGYLVFSDESDMYCWHGSKGHGAWKKNEWKYFANHDWSSEYLWIHRGKPISDMCDGKGWTHYRILPYFILESLPINYINWTQRNPMEVKE